MIAIVNRYQRVYIQGPRCSSSVHAKYVTNADDTLAVQLETAGTYLDLNREKDLPDYPTQSQSQPPRPRRPRPSKLQPRSIHDSDNSAPKRFPFLAHQDLRDGLPARTKIPQNQLQGLNLPQQASLHDPAHDIGPQLICCIIGTPRMFAKADIPCRDGY